MGFNASVPERKEFREWGGSTKSRPTDFFSTEIDVVACVIVVVASTDGSVDDEVARRKQRRVSASVCVRQTMAGG